MKSFEEISKMNLAELDRPAGAGEEELETETTGAAGNHSVSDAEKAGTPGADDLETSINMSAAVSDNEEEKQPEELEKKVMMEPQGKHYRIDADITQSALNTFTARTCPTADERDYLLTALYDAAKNNRTA